MSKISAYAQLTSPAAGDKLLAVDVSDTSMAATGTDKWVALSDLTGGNVSPSGDTTGAADTAAINALIAAGDPVLLGPGTFWVTSGVTLLPNLAVIRGSGFATTVKLAASQGATANMFETATNANACMISGMILDGNKGNNASTWQCGIVLNNPAAGSLYNDSRHQCSNLLIQNFTGDGFVQVGQGVVQASDIQSWVNDGFGFNLNQDSEYTNCDAGSCGIDGFLIQSGSNRLAGCKAWFSGRMLVSSRIAGATLLTRTAPANSWDGGGITGETFSLANGYGNGFHIGRNISGSSELADNAGGSYAACGAQDNARAGLYIRGSNQVVQAFEADSNNNNGTTSGVPNASYAGIDLDCSNSIVTGKSWDRAANVNHQAAALNLVSTISANNNNSIQLSFSGTLNDASNMPPLTAGSTIADNSVMMKAQGRSIQVRTFQSSFTPDPFAAEVLSVILTGNVTFANPALAGTNTTGLFLIPGMRLTLMTQQDGTGGRTVTFGTAYKVSWTPVTTANLRNVISFVYDGTNWVQTAVATGLPA